MLLSANELGNYKLNAADGKVGSIDDFYFDDETFTVRYIVVNTGNWLSSRKNLISPSAITNLDRENEEIRVGLTKEKVEKSPGIDKHKPVSRQMESLIADYYGFSYYWNRPDFTAEQLAAANRVAAMRKSFEETGSGAGAAALPYEAPDVHLRSLREITNYNIAATDDEVGAIIDFILDIDGDWKIRYMALDTGNWLPGRKVLISPQSLDRIDWANRKIHLNLTRVQIKNSPEYNEVKEITRDYETRLNKHYGHKTAGQI